MINNYRTCSIETLRAHRSYLTLSDSNNAYLNYQTYKDNVSRVHTNFKIKFWLYLTGR